MDISTTPRVCQQKINCLSRAAGRLFSVESNDVVRILWFATVFLSIGISTVPILTLELWHGAIGWNIYVVWCTSMSILSVYSLIQLVKISCRIYRATLAENEEILQTKSVPSLRIGEEHAV